MRREPKESVSLKKAENEQVAVSLGQRLGLVVSADVLWLWPQVGTNGTLRVPSVSVHPGTGVGQGLAHEPTDVVLARAPAAVANGCFHLLSPQGRGSENDTQPEVPRAV